MSTHGFFQRLAPRALVLACLSAMSASAGENDLPSPAARATDSAVERNSQPTVDPWTASTASALFSRPTLGETFKFSSEASKAGTVMSLGFSPGWLWAQNSALLTNLQVIGTYSIGDNIGSFGVKWAAPFRDVRAFSAVDLKRISDASLPIYEKCDKDVKDKSDAAAIAACRKLQSDAEDKEIARINAQPGRLGLSLGASVGYGFRSRRLERVAANVAYDQKLWSGASLILNADLESEPRELQEDAGVRVDRTWKAGGSAGLAWRPGADWLKQRLELSAGAKALACLQSCGEKASSVKFGPQASFALDKDTVLGASLSWSAEAVSLREALIGVAVSHSFGLSE
ncbi:hypothetical protein HJC22_20705 [Corallococcus exiguus]|uniref:hypothetical protein n=1 Tax=Corallococcus TaxID=83461 RepID=UPI000F890689|nr:MULTISPECIES: hypothetical protein [Corallococcus]NNC18136.1 hypothetical protein [Corallococcus exiguus]RUO91779.1 hypothetical protein D7Y11_18145 [Corallococcus sp. AB018]